MRFRGTACNYLAVSERALPCARERKGKNKSHRMREDYVEDICACTHVVVVVLVVPYQGQESGYLPVQSDESTG